MTPSPQRSGHDSRHQEPSRFHLVLVWADRIVLGSLAPGIGMMLQPWIPALFRWGFWLTLLCVLLHILTSHLVAGTHRP